MPRTSRRQRTTKGRSWSSRMRCSRSKSKPESCREKTYEQEAQLRANNLRLQQMDLDKELAQAELNHKSKYEIRKRYLEAELAAAQGNEDAIAQIQLEMAENEEALWEERIEKLREYAEMASGFANAFNDLASALGERRAQEVEEQYSREEQALANMYANGQITEASTREEVKMEKQKEKELAKIEREQAIRERAMGSFEIGINTAISIMASAKMGFPLAIPFIAAAAALGAVQMAALWAAPLPKAARGNTLRDPVMPLEECTLRRKEARPSLTRSRAACSCLFCQP